MSLIYKSKKIIDLIYSLIIQHCFENQLINILTIPYLKYSGNLFPFQKFQNWNPLDWFGLSGVLLDKLSFSYFSIQFPRIIFN